MTSNRQHHLSGQGAFPFAPPVLTTCLLTRRRVIDQMRTASATCR